MTGKTPNRQGPFDDMIWLELFEAAFMDDGKLAERAARLWQYLVSQIESGPEGITNARQSLETAIRLIFPFTEIYKSCRDQFEASLVESPKLK